TPVQMLAEMERRFDFLVSRARHSAPLHRSMREAVSWSCRLLPPDLMQFFASLSALEDRWTFELAEAVCEEPLALDYLAQLWEASLVAAEETPVGMAFSMLQML